MRAALASINDVEAGEWKVESTSKFFDAGTQFAFWKRREFVEQGLYKLRPNNNHQELKGNEESPDIKDEIVACPIDQIKHRSDDHDA